MSANGLLQIALYPRRASGLGEALGWYMARVYEGKLPAFVRWMAPSKIFFTACAA